MPKRLLTVAAAALGLWAVSALPAAAEDTLYKLSIADAMAMPVVTDNIDSSVKFYFGDAAHPAVVQDFGSYVSNKKANSVGKSDKQSCTRAFASALISLRDRAHDLGANAVIDIHSYFKQHDVSSETDVECYVGTLMNGVALKGEFVKLGE